MKRSLACALFAVLLLPACRTAGPRVVPSTAGPDPLRPYVGEVRVLRSRADERNVTVGAKQRLTGDCDMAVRVRSAAFQKGGALFSLETIGRPSVAGREPRCRTIQPAIQLLFAGASPGAADLAARVDAVLQTSEAYLRSKGVVFDRPASPSPREIATPDVLGVPAESVLGKKVTAWPKLLLSVNPYARAANRRVRQESEVEFDGIVGTDGRVYEPKLKTALSQAHQDIVLAALTRWRYEPAHTAQAPVAARINSRMALRIY